MYIYLEKAGFVQRGIEKSQETLILINSQQKAQIPQDVNHA